MRAEGYVSAPVVCAQYGITRAQLLDVVLQGKIRPQKPDSSSIFYCNWADCLKYFSTPAEYRARPKNAAVQEVDSGEPELILDGMIPPSELDDMYRKENDSKIAARKAAGIAVNPNAPLPVPAPRVVIRPADLAPEDKK